jgi:hypothetical protein
VVKIYELIDRDNSGKISVRAVTMLEAAVLAVITAANIDHQINVKHLTIDDILKMVGHEGVSYAGD